MRSLYILSVAILTFALFFEKSSAHQKPANLNPHDGSIRLSGAFKSLEQWTFERSYPGQTLSTKYLLQAYDHQMADRSGRTPTAAPWQHLGPFNVAGRTLCLAFHPDDPDVIYAGTASGGLWKTTTSGLGPDAWREVPTGFPILAVSSIAIHPENPDIMYIGTGEVYSTYDITEPGQFTRITRGTYGLGLFKTTDGGESWTQSVDYSLDDLKGIQDIEIDPIDQNTLFAASTDGLLRSTDGGDSWTLVHNVPMAVDVEIVTGSPKRVFVTHGNLNFNDNTVPSGVFMSEDNGDSFSQITNGLPNAFSGKGMISPSPSEENIIYASIQHLSWSPNDTTTPLGLYKSDDRGSSWTKINNRNVAQFQGWYSHDVAVDPNDPDALVYVGIDSWVSDDGGASLEQVSFWNLWTFGELPNTGPDGPFNYVHADMHAAYFHPTRPGHVYLATDGGIFVSEDGGRSYESRNEGMTTTQFYPRMDNAASDSTLIIGGTQDNATYLRQGPDTWWRVFGGDGMSAYFDPEDPLKIYGSAQGLYMLRWNTTDTVIEVIAPQLAENEFPAFNAPYIISPHDPTTLYAGAQHVYRSTDRGSSWERRTSEVIGGNNRIMHIAANPVDPNILYLTTAPNPFTTDKPTVMKSRDRGATWEELDGLPDRVAKYIAIDPEFSSRVYVVFSGFGTDHLYISEDGGNTWDVPEFGLPDVPTNTIIVDPLNPADLYLGNDIGVYYSDDYGMNWRSWMEGLPEVVMVMDLSISESNRMLRVGTHGRGIYERPLEYEEVADSEFISIDESSVRAYPNPASKRTNITFALRHDADAQIQLVDLQGRVLMKRTFVGLSIGENTVVLDWASLQQAPGSYLVQLRVGDEQYVLPMVILQGA